MNYFLTLIFVSALALSTTVSASEPTSHDAQCGAENKTPACDEKKDGAHHSTNHHGDLSEKMNSLFPEKQKKAELGARPSIVEIKTPTFLSSVAAGSVKLEWKEAKGATKLSCSSGHWS